MDILFSTVELHARELREDEIPTLQAFYEANPAYSLRVNGVPPPADSALEEFHERPPAHLPYTQRWLLGVFDREGALAAVIDCVRDLCAPGVWHLGLFLVATARHGRGDAQALYDAWEAWVRSHGPDAAQWLRLGVVVGNTPAERFWARQGYLQTRLREGVDTGGRVNTIRAMVKPLDPAHGSQTPEDWMPVYLTQVPRDAPGSSLP